MLDYFRYSQKVKKEIEADSSLLEKITSVINSREGDSIGEGTNNEVYRIGQTKNGLFLALRVPVSDTTIHCYESFCQMAAMRSSEYNIGRKHPVIGKVIRPVRFCVGVLSDEANSDRVWSEENPAILTEDVTENGKYTLKSGPGKEQVVRIEKKRVVDEVLVDLDDIPDLDILTEIHWEIEIDPDGKLERPKYFSEANRIDM